MHTNTRLPKILALVLTAAALGIAVLQVGPVQRTELIAAAQAASSAGAAVSPATSPAGSPPGALVADVGAPTPIAATSPVPRRRGGVTCEQPHRLVQVPRDAVIHASPGGRVVGTLPARSRYLGSSMTAWIQAVSKDGRWGRVTLPWSKPVGQAGWVRIDGLVGRTTSTMVVSDLSDLRVYVYRGCRELFSVRSAIGRPGSPSPKGRFWVTDRIAVPGAQQARFGTYAFGLSTIQPKLPVGWTGKDQMAIHGTGAPGSIGKAASAGCLRVNEQALARLKPLLRAGTPVVIRA